MYRYVIKYKQHPQISSNIDINDHSNVHLASILTQIIDNDTESRPASNIDTDNTGNSTKFDTDNINKHVNPYSAIYKYYYNKIHKNRQNSNSISKSNIIKYLA